MYRVDTAQQRLMEEAFYHQLHERCQPQDEPDRPLPMIVGVETEYLIVDEQGHLVPESLRNDILSALPHSSPELGISTIETHTFPMPLVGQGGRFFHELYRIEQETIKAARHAGCRLVRIGTYPGPFSDFGITQYPDRYQRLMDIAHDLHNVEDEQTPLVQLGTLTLPRKRCHVMSGCQSIHINIQVPAGALAIQMVNKAIELVPYLVALGAHSPIMNCQPSGFEEIRIPLWEPLFTFPHIDARYGVHTQRTGLPDQYYADWYDYWRDVGNKLFFTHDTQRAFDSNIKQFWRTVRLKPCPTQLHDCILEIRALSTQPTIEDDAAFYMLIGALLHNREWLNKPLVPIEYARSNVVEASKHGLGAHFYALDTAGELIHEPVATLVDDLIDEACRMWQPIAPEAAEQVARLRWRLEPDQETPALASLRRYEQELSNGRSPQEAARNVLLNYVVTNT